MQPLSGRLKNIFQTAFCLTRIQTNQTQTIPRLNIPTNQLYLLKSQCQP